MREHGKHGVCLLPNKHNVLEVRPLRALRPMLSTDSQFCALNLYQLAIMATLSYNQFGQAPDKTPIRDKKVSFPQKPSVVTGLVMLWGNSMKSGKPTQPNPRRTTRSTKMYRTPSVWKSCRLILTYTQ